VEMLASILEFYRSAISRLAQQPVLPSAAV